jgi:hypothetical protein
MGGTAVEFPTLVWGCLLPWWHQMILLGLQTQFLSLAATPPVHAFSEHCCIGVGWAGSFLVCNSVVDVDHL